MIFKRKWIIFFFLAIKYFRNWKHFKNGNWQKGTNNISHILSSISFWNKKNRYLHKCIKIYNLNFPSRWESTYFSFLGGEGTCLWYSRCLAIITSLENMCKFECSCMQLFHYLGTPCMSLKHWPCFRYMLKIFHLGGKVPIFVSFGGGGGEGACMWYSRCLAIITSLENIWVELQCLMFSIILQKTSNHVWFLEVQLCWGITDMSIN